MNILKSEKQTVLVVDDNPDNITVLHSILIDEYRIVAATSGALALKIASSRPQPDIILLDIMMPEMDGYEVCKQLKSDLRTKRIPIIFVTALGEIDDETLGFDLGAVDYITKPVSPPIVKARVRTQLALYDQNRILQKKVDEQTKELKNTQLEIIERLGRAAEYKDNETGKHVIRMSKFTYLLALGLGMSEKDASMLEYAAPMHDLGKIGIPDYILKKPGKLDDEEREIMNNHVIYGANIIGETNSELLKMAKIIAQGHHEKWDGSGYPNGLKKEEIPLIARIVAVADVFDALTSIRPYKKAWSVDDTVEHIEQQGGSHFDPNIVGLVRENIGAFKEIMNQYSEH